MITLNGIPNCDTVKKARAWLDAHGVQYRFRDFKKEPPSTAELARWAGAAGWETLLNRRGTTFRALADTDKADMDQAKALRLLTTYPSLIKRPVVTEGKRLTVGFSDALFADNWG